MEGPEFDRIAALPGQAESLLHRVVAELEAVEESYGHLPFTDVRRSALNKFVNALFPAHIGLLVLREQLFDPAWWVRPGRSLYPPHSVAIALEEYERSLKFGLLMSSFSATESTFRSVAKAVEPSTGSRRPSFKTVYDGLFAAIDTDAALRKTMDLYRLLRNSSHNNSVHFSNSETVLWRGKSYEFLDGCIISFLTWDILFALTMDVSAITAHVISHPLVRAVPGIEDPYAL